jgi:hypothetical protein
MRPHSTIPMRTRQFRRTAHDNLGDLFTLLPDLPWTNSALRMRASHAQRTRERLAATVKRNQLTSERRRALFAPGPSRPKQRKA